MDEPKVLLSRFLTGVGLGELGLVATPVGILLSGSGHGKIVELKRNARSD